MKNIFYIHGAMSTPKSFNYIIDKLQESGNQQFITYDLNKDDAFDIVVYNVNKIKRMLGPMDKIVFIGHSFGGVLAVDIANKLYEAGYKSISVISIASPFGGSAAASWMRLMKPGSLLLAISTAKTPPKE